MHVPTSIVLAGALLVFNVLCEASHRALKSQSGHSSSSNSQGNASLEDCLTIVEAQKHVGKSHCVSGTVVRVEEGNNGVTFLDFCADYRSCPFTAIVFPGDLRSVGDVRLLQGHVVSIKGTIEEYDDRAEIILRHPQQLGDSAALLPALPKDYDVERAGHASAGSFRRAKRPKTKHKQQGPPIPLEDPEEP